MGNYRKKKQAAAVHNKTMEILENILYIGESPDKKVLMMNMDSRDENVFNYYYAGTAKISDIRDPDEKDTLYFSPQKIIELMKQHYGEDKIGELFNKNEIKYNTDSRYSG